MVNCCVAVGCKNRAKKVLAYFSFYFHIKTHRDLTNGFMLLEERTGNHQHIVVYVVITLKKSVLWWGLVVREENSHKMLCLQFFQCFPLITRNQWMQAGESLLEKGNIFLLKNLPLTVSHPLWRYRKITLTQQNPFHLQRMPKRWKELEKIVRVLKEIIRKKNKKISTLKDIVQSLKENKLVTETKHDLLEHNFEGVSKEIVHNQIYNSRVASKHLQHYNETVKKFAVTLHYYSPKAYNFVWDVLLFPHLSTIQTWAASVNCEPSLLHDVIKVIGDEAKKIPSMSNVVLMLDAMAFHKGTWWEPKQKCYVGCVDYGTGIP